MSDYAFDSTADEWSCGSYQRAVLERLDRIIALLERGAAPVPAVPTPPHPHGCVWVVPTEPAPLPPDPLYC